MTDTTLTFTRHIKASPATVWRCWTEPDLLRQWFAPKPVETTEAEIDPRPGGIFRTVMVVPEHGTMAGDPGCILVAEPATRLVWTNCLGPDFVPNVIGTGPMDFGFSAEILMEPENGGCRYTATVRHATKEHTEAHAAMGFHDGWGTATTQLETLARTL
ncbi:SRPBCC family protein [Oceaniglobus roseus]|uniref:SRPBCC family protein n=1 Tax=Oceaniglobus roseus TaxID=1737570 RepID=UPI000C7F58CD|nr:SRPBCC family protein [Kandeliimicrobium roseum]